MKRQFVTAAACMTIAAHGTVSAAVQIHAVVVDGPSGVVQVTEDRPIFHTLSLIKNSTSASASGDLRSGVLRAEAVTRPETGANGTSFAAVEVMAGDLITFAQGASGTAYVDWGFDGSLDIEPNGPNPNNVSSAYLGFSITSPSGTATSLRLATVTANANCSGASTQYCVTGPFSHAEVAMRGSAPFEIRAGTFALSFALGASVRGGDDAYFGNTTYLYLRLPANVNFTSGSGVFLANAVPVPAPVPEPATSLLLAGGCLALIATRRWRAHSESIGIRSRGDA